MPDPDYHIVPAVDDDNNFPPVVRAALAESDEMHAMFETQLPTYPTLIAAEAAHASLVAAGVSFVLITGS